MGLTVYIGCISAGLEKGAETWTGHVVYIQKRQRLRPIRVLFDLYILSTDLDINDLVSKSHFPHRASAPQ